MTTPHRLLKQSNIANTRQAIAQDQKYICPICRQSIAGGKVALDHNHSNGYVRGVLCGICNRNEGKVLKAMRYMATKGHPVWEFPSDWLRSLADYLDYHERNPSYLIHPTFDVVKGRQKPVKRRRKK